MTSQELLNPRNARVLLCLALAGSGVLLIAWQSHLTFLADDWDLLLYRRGFNPHALLDPHSRHLIIGPALVYKAIQATLGMDSYTPYGAVATATFLASVALLYVYVRRRVGDWVALASVLPILVMGSAYEDLLSAFQIGYFGSMAFGIGALLVIERTDRHRDAFASALLVASLAFAEIALAFAAGVAVAIALQRGPLRRAWVVVLPILLYAIWYPTFGQSGAHLGPSSFSLHHVATSPPYVLDGFASSAGSLLGLGTPLLFGGTGGLEWGRSVLLAFGAVSIAWVVRGRPAQRRWVLVPLAAGVAFWFLTAANFGFGRSPSASRYQYVGAVFLVMIAAQLAAGWRPGWRGIVAVLAVGIVAALGNLSMLHKGYRALDGLSALVRGGLAGLDITADRVRPDLELTPANSDVDYFTLLEAGPYLSAAEKFGSPAYSQDELATAPERARVAADKVMAAALPVALVPGPATYRGCTSVTGTGAGAPIVSLPPGGASLSAPSGAGASLALRRYAGDSFPVDPGPLHGQARLVIPTDRSSRPWQLKVDAPGPVSICPL
jgi:hypothetical protein